MFSRVSLLRSSRLAQTSIARCKSATTAEQQGLASAVPASQPAVAVERVSVPVITSVLAGTAGVLTVSAAAAAVETATARSVPPFDMHNHRFDQTHYSGRFFRMILRHVRAHIVLVKCWASPPGARSG